MSRRWALVVLVACLTFPSIPAVIRYTGMVGVVAYVLLTVGAVAWWCRARTITSASRLSPLATRWLMAGLLLVMLLLFLAVYPLVNSSVPGQGSDRDDALNMAVRALLNGEHPYRELTYLGNPITPLPGALLLAIPFVLAGNSAYQNLFWLAAFAFTAAARLRTPGVRTWLLGALLLCPALWQDFLTGGDLLANALYVFVAAVWMIDCVLRQEPSALAEFGAALFLGLALTSRPYFVLLIPLVFAVIARQRGWSQAAICVGISVATMAVLTLPLYLADPAAFSPLHVAGKLRHFDGVLPHAAYWVPLLSLVTACVAALGVNAANFTLRAALVLSVPLLGAVALDPIANGGLSVTHMAHGLSFMVFGVVASSQVMFGEARHASGGLGRFADVAPAASKS
jgi:hypothetical protein